MPTIAELESAWRAGGGHLDNASNASLRCEYGDVIGFPLPGCGVLGGIDATPPVASGFFPADNATGVSTAPLLIVSFNSIVRLGTGNVTLKTTVGNTTVEAWNVATEAGTGAGQVSIEFGTQLTLRLTSSLTAATEYYVIWDANVVKDIFNNPVAASASTTAWSFTTA
jgi:hypothetical protein